MPVRIGSGFDAQPAMSASDEAKSNERNMDLQEQFATPSASLQTRPDLASWVFATTSQLPGH